MIHYYHRIALIVLTLLIVCTQYTLAQQSIPSQPYTAAEVSRYTKQAQQVKIIRDKWGVPHIYGQTDADAVFGLLYAQCEENFMRVERNYIEMMGRLAEIEGEGQVFADLQMKLIYDSADAVADYHKSPTWFKKLLNAFADGVNYYLYTHPQVRPALLTRFEPWYPLLYTDGSIAPTQTGGLTIQDLRNLYSNGATAYQPNTSAAQWATVNTSGSNGFAIAPARSATGEAMLYINPHVTFYFRSEVHMVSNEGLNAYGAVTWGQFFVYQGFNQHCGWMHTSSYADVADVYREAIERRGDSVFQRYNGALLPVKTRQVTVSYKNGGGIVPKTFTTYTTVHGPVLGQRNGQWLSLKENNRSMDALIQSWLRTKARGLDDFKKVMDMKANNSNNTVFADNKGNIAYWHGNFMPIRDTAYDFSQPVDGATSATNWKGLHRLDEIVHIYNPASGWIQNCNSTPFTAAGSSSPHVSDYPRYMAPDGENFRGINAVRLLGAAQRLTLDSIIAIGYNRYLAAFDVLLLPLLEAYKGLQAGDSLHRLLEQPVLLLGQWNKVADKASVATTLAIEWATKMAGRATPPQSREQATHAIRQVQTMVDNTSATEKLQLLLQVMQDLDKDFGTWQVPWGHVNLYQRSFNPVTTGFNDSLPSLPVSQASSQWGSLPSFATRRQANGRRYGVSGNSFIAAVTFGSRIRAKTVITGGQSFYSGSPHFADQAQMYIDGVFKDVLFYKEDVLKNMHHQYHPGEASGWK